MINNANESRNEQINCLEPMNENENSKWFLLMGVYVCDRHGEENLIEEKQIKEMNSERKKTGKIFKVLQHFKCRWQ